MDIPNSLCKLCKSEETKFGFIFCEKRMPICEKCIKFIKSLKKKDYVKCVLSEEDKKDE